MPGQSTPTKAPRMTASSSEESVSLPRQHSASGSAFSPPHLSHSSEDSLVNPVWRLDRLTRASLFRTHSRPFITVNFEAGSPSTGGLQALDPGYLGDLSDRFRVRSESPASQPWEPYSAIEVQWPPRGHLRQPPPFHLCQGQCFVMQCRRPLCRHP